MRGVASPNRSPSSCWRSPLAPGGRSGQFAAFARIPDQGGVPLQLRDVRRVAGATPSRRRTRRSSIGIVGRDPFGWALDQTVENKRISKRRIVIERLQPHQDLRHCQILFIASSERRPRRRAVAAPPGTRPILIVDDAAGRRPARRCTMDFIVDDNKVGFAINLDAAKRARLIISSKMLWRSRRTRPVDGERSMTFSRHTVDQAEADADHDRDQLAGPAACLGRDSSSTT